MRDIRRRGIVFLLSGLFLLAQTAFCSDNPFKHFKENISKESLKPFARDIGGILGSASYNTARSLGFPGFDVGFRAAAQFKPSPDDTALKRSGVKAFGFPWVQAEIGMPFRLDGFIRGFSHNGLAVSGGGVRYGIRKISDAVHYSQFMITAMGNSAVHTDFSAVHFGVNAVMSYKLQSVTPYLGGGIDVTRVSVKSADQTAVLGSEASAWEARFTLGFNFRVAQYGYICAAGNILHGQPAAEASIGTRF